LASLLDERKIEDDAMSLNDWEVGTEVSAEEEGAYRKDEWERRKRVAYGEVPVWNEGI
jgi:hypothetical protein